MKTHCKRLHRNASEHVCQGCLRDCSIRSLLIKEAEQKKIDWVHEPCMYECNAGVPEEVSVAENHWKSLDNVTPPPIFQKALNLASSGKKVVSGLIRGRTIKTTATVRRTRLKICESCSLYDIDTGICGECGCFMAAKVGLAVESCPLNKWEQL